MFLFLRCIVFALALYTPGYRWFWMLITYPLTLLFLLSRKVLLRSFIAYIKHFCQDFWNSVSCVDRYGTHLAKIFKPEAIILSIHPYKESCCSRFQWCCGALCSKKGESFIPKKAVQSKPKFKVVDPYMLF